MVKKVNVAALRPEKSYTDPYWKTFRKGNKYMMPEDQKVNFVKL